MSGWLSLNESWTSANSTVSNTTISLQQLERPKPKYVSLLLFSLALITVAGNCLVVIAISRFRELRTVTNQMMLSLAIADLLIGVVVMPLNISNELLHYWPYGQVMCDLWHSFDVLASTASILNLCIISLDRYWAVTNPIAYPRLMSKRRGWICISIVWVCSSLISFPTILWWRSVDNIVPEQCNFTQDSMYLALSSMISFYIPLTVMAAVYIRIFLVIKRQSKQQSAALRAHRGGEIVRSHEFEMTQVLFPDSDSPTTTNDTRVVDSVEKLNSVNESEKRRLGFQTEPNNLKRLVLKVNKSKRMDNSLSNEYRVARTLGLVIGIFLLFWLPFFVCNLIHAICKSCIDDEKVFVFVTWLGYVNSGVNPIIYALSMEHMRHAFINIVTCQCDKYYNYKKSRQRKIGIGNFYC